jgi:hypothetical protein
MVSQKIAYLRHCHIDRARGSHLLATSTTISQTESPARSYCNTTAASGIREGSKNQSSERMFYFLRNQR